MIIDVLGDDEEECRVNDEAEVAAVARD